MLVQEVLEDRMSYQHGSMGASWQQGHHLRNGAHNYFWGAHKKNEGTRNIAEDFWRYHGMPEPVQGEHAIELNKQLINLGLGKDAFDIHKDVPFFQQSAQIEAMVAPFHHNLPNIHPRDLVFPSELQPNDINDLQTMADYMSQLNYSPDEIRQRLEEERQKYRGLFRMT